MRRGIPASHAKVMQAHDTGAVIPQVGITQCSPACVYYTWCRNFENLELCKGFKLIENGKNTQHIMRTLSEMDKLYVENSVRDLPKFKPENREMILRDVVRILEPSSGRFMKEESTTKLGFCGMLDSINPSEPEEVQSKVVIRGFGRGFLGMVDELSRDSKPVIRSSHPQERKSTRRGFGDGFIGMLDRLSRDSETPAPVHRVIEFRSIEEKEEEKVVRFCTFQSLLHNLSQKQERESENAKAKIPNTGFRRMLDGQSLINTDERVPVDPIWRKLQREIRAIIDGT